MFNNNREVLFDASSVCSRKCRLRDVVHALIGTVLDCSYLSGCSHEFMFFNTVERKDHVELFTLIENICQFDKGELKWVKRRGINLYNLKNLITNFTHIKELKQIEIPKESISCGKEKYMKLDSLQLVTLYIKLIRNLGVKKSISKYQWKGIDSLVVLYDIGEPEHFVVERANSCGIKTVTLSHGILLPQFNHLDVGTYNLYKVPSRFLLSWGEDVKEILEGRNENVKVIVCGCPRIREKPHNILHGLIGVAGSSPYDTTANCRMIQIAEQYARVHGKKVRIRLHPQDCEKKYELDMSVAEFNGSIDECEMIIAYRTAMIFTYMVKGKKVMRYKDEVPYYDFPEGIEFRSFQELEKNMEKVHDIDFKTIAKKHIQYIDHESESKYREAFLYIRDWRFVETR